MSENNVLYDVLSERVEMLAKSFDGNVPYHRFSRRYMRKEKEILKAYLKSQEKRESIDLAYNSIKRGNRIKFAVIVVIAALFLAGFTIYITHYIGNMRIKEYDTHSLAYVLNADNTPKILEHRYEITYDLGDWEKGIIEDDQYGFFITYRNDEKDGINFSYRSKSTYQGIRYNTEGSQIEKIVINNRTYIHYITPKGINCFIWETEDIIFEFSHIGLDDETAAEIISSIAEI